MGGEPSPRPPLRLLTAVAAAGLLAGFLAGGRGPSDSGSPVVAEPVQLVAGSVQPISTGRGEFEVSIHNGGATDVSVSVVGIPDWDTTPHVSADVRITPDTWQAVRFTAEVNCTQPPFTVRSVEVRTRYGDGTLRTELPLAAPDTALRDHHLVECTPATTLDKEQMVGVWMLDEVRGEDSWLADRLMIWLRRDGTFVWDAEGGAAGQPAGQRRPVRRPRQPPQVPGHRRVGMSTTGPAGVGDPGPS